MQLLYAHATALLRGLRRMRFVLQAIRRTIAPTLFRHFVGVFSYEANPPYADVPTMSLETPLIRMGYLICVGASCPQKRIEAFQNEGLVVNICPTETCEPCPWHPCPVILAAEREMRQ